MGNENARMTALVSFFFICLAGVLFWERESISSSLQWGEFSPILLAALVLGIGLYCAVHAFYELQGAQTFNRIRWLSMIAGSELLGGSSFIFAVINPGPLLGFSAFGAMLLGIVLLYYGIELRGKH